MRRAVFAGSFDPVTTGHIDIVERAASMFDELIVCIFHNVAKEGCFPLEQRVAFLRTATAHVPNVRYDFFTHAPGSDVHQFLGGARADPLPWAGAGDCPAACGAGDSETV